MPEKKAVVPIGKIEQRILLIRGDKVSVFIVRAFVKLRRMIAENKELSRRIVQIERHLADHDEQIIELIKAIKQLLKPDPLPKKRQIGY